MRFKILTFFLFMFAVSRGLAQVPTFAGPVSINMVTSGASSIVQGDFTGDGKIDIAAAYISNKSISIYRNNGSGAFVWHSTTTMTGATALPYDIVAGDFDLDGDLDIAAALISSLAYFTNTGTGSFTYNLHPSVGSSQMSITAGQFDGDGKLDLAVASPNSAVGQKLIVLQNVSGPGNGGIWFGTPTGYASGNFPNDVEAADVNNDGKVDLLSVNTSSASVSVLLGDGLGYFAAPTSFLTSMDNPIDMTVADFNSDGFKDFVVTRNGFSEARLMLNNGSGGFPTATVLPIDPAGLNGSPGLGVISGDFNGDNKADIVFRAYNSSLFVYAGTGTGTFGAASTFSAGGVDILTGLVSADFNSDNRPDLAVIESGSTRLITFTNNGTYSPEPTVAASNVTFANLAPTAVRIQWTPGNGTSRIVVVRQGLAVNQPPVDLTAYTANANFTLGQEIVVGGGNRVVYAGTGSFVDVTGLTAGTNYHVAVYEFNGSGATTNYRITGAPVNNVTTLAAEPTTSATAMTFTNITPNSVRVQWTSGNGAGRLVVAKQASAVNQLPADQVVYVANANFPLGQEIVVGGGNRVVYAANSNFVDITGLTAGTVYHFSVFEYNGSAATINYRTTSPAIGNVSTLAPEPTTSATVLTFTNITATSVRAQWTSGNGAARIVVAKQTSAVNQAPVDRTTYTANASFPSGQEIVVGSGNRVVYAGTGAFVDVTGLTPGATYHFAVYEYNGAALTLNYKTSAPAINNVTTLAAEPTTSATAMTFTNVTVNSVRVQWTSGNGAARLVVAKQASAVNQLPADQVVYVANANFPLGQEIVAGGGNRVVYAANSNFVDITGLTAGTVYHFSVFEYNGSAATINYRTTSPAIGNVSTLAPEPTTSATVLTFTNITATSVRAQWTSGNGAARIVVAKQASAVNQAPVDRTAYTANASFPSGQEIVVGSGNRVVYAGTGAFVDVTGLTPGATNHFAVYEYNGAALTLNYKTTTPAINSVITAPDVYVVNPANGSTSNSITLTVNGAVGATSYTIEMNSSSTFAPATAVVKTSSNLSNNFPEMAFGTVYYTRVKTNLSALWGSTRSFTTATAPAFAYLTSPANGATTTSTSLTSNVVPAATLYTIEVSTSSTFPVGATTITKSNASRTMNFPELTFSQLYYARVKTNLSATWGPVQTFTTGTVDNFTYVTTPVNGGTTSQYNVTANNIVGATLYTIELNTSSTFAVATAITKQGASRTQAFPTLVYNQLYYTRVKTNLSPNWGPTRTFTTLGPDAFSYLISPANGSLDVPIDVQLVPNTINGTTSYTLTVSQNPDYSAPFFEEPGTGNPYAPTMFGLAYGTLYYVRVKTSLSPNWGPTRSFTTVADPGGRRRTSGSSNAEIADRAYPNSVTDHLNFFVHSKVDEDAAVTIVDGKGSIVYQSATNAYSTNREQRIDDLQHLSRGMYYVSVSFGHERRLFRIVKAN
jgi:hypothetical protein